MTQNKKERKNN